MYIVQLYYSLPTSPPTSTVTTMSRSNADAAVGMMDSAYFVSKKELLDFFNSTLDLSLAKIEQTCTGAVACQLFEYIFPKSIPVAKIDWGCKSSFEYIHNYKLLQAAFTKHRVRRHLDVDKLIRGKFQDNLEFTQWLKAFHDQQNIPIRPYDPVAVRSKGKGGRSLPPQFRHRGAGGRIGGGIPRPGTSSGRDSISGSRPKLSLSADTPTSTRPSTASTPRHRIGGSIPSSSGKRSSNGSGFKLPPGSSRRNSSLKENATPSKTNAATAAAAAAEHKAALAEATQKATDLTTRVAELELMLQRSEQEKDFYFEKLRGIESMVHAHNGGNAEALVEQIGKVLNVAVGEDVPVDAAGQFVEGGKVGAIDVYGAVSGIRGAASSLDLLKEVANDGNDMDLSLIEA